MRRVGFVLLSIAAVLSAALETRVARAAGETVFATNFDGPDTLDPWEPTAQPGVRLVQGDLGSRSLLVERTEKEGSGYRNIRVPLPLEKLRGTRVKVEARIKADAVARPPNPWNGVKCMLHTVTPGGSRWDQQNGLFGSFDFKPVRFVCQVPADATEAWLVLGLEQTSGRAWFDDLRVTVIGRRRSTPEQAVAGPATKGHDLPRLRGAMIGPHVTAEDLRVLGRQWNANHVRWQLIWGGFPNGPADKADVAAYEAWLESALVHLDELLPVCREVGLKVLIDLHTPPGGRDQSSRCRMFAEKMHQEAFLRAWDKIARRYRGNTTVWGYDLVNEPVEGIVGQGLLDWRSLALQTAKNVRRIDPDHAIVVEPAPWGSPASLDFFEPLPVEGVVYSVHMYIPHQFTHQGIHGNPKGIHYPGPVDGKHYDKGQLRLALQPAIDYQRDYGVHVYLGEFSAIRWAPGDSAANYLRDCIDLFEENGWDWAYHAFREWDGWSVEHGPDPGDRTPAKTATDRQQLLRQWYARNKKPQA